MSNRTISDVKIEYGMWTKVLRDREGESGKAKVEREK